MPTITPRKNKSGEIISYTIRVYHGYDSKGKRLKPYTMTYKPAPGMTAKQVEKELQKISLDFEERCQKGIAGNAEKITLEEFAKVYLEIKKPSFSERTYDAYSKAIDSLIIPALGSHKISQIKPAHVQMFVQQLCNMPKSRGKNGEKLSESSVRRYLAILQSIFRLAVKQRIITDSPAKAEYLELPRVIPPKTEIFSKQEAAKMLSYLEEESLQFQTLIQLAIMTGARRGELVALKFSDFDYENNKVTIERAAVSVSHQPIIIKRPKDYEVRTVAVNPYCIDLVKLLRAEKDRQAERLGSQWHENDWLFTQDNGELMHPNTPSAQFSKFLKKYGMNHRKFHSLRHTSATLLLYGGVNIKQVQERLGHSNLETTNKYLHCISEADEQAANVLQDMLITHKVKEKKHA